MPVVTERRGRFWSFNDARRVTSFIGIFLKTLPYHVYPVPYHNYFALYYPIYFRPLLTAVKVKMNE